MVGPTTFTFREKIPRSNTNLILSVPDLTYRNMILSHIDFSTEQWNFEAVLKTGSSELVKMSTTFFQHNQSLDLSGYRSKIEEGDKLDLCIKPKQAPKDIELMICYTYSESNGALYYQNSDRLIDLGESKILSDITDKMNPLKLYIKCDVPMCEVALVPKFIENEEVEYRSTVDGDTFELNFDDEELSEIVPLLKFYDLKIKCENNTVDTQVHFMVRGFKN